MCPLVQQLRTYKQASAQWPEAHADSGTATDANASSFARAESGVAVGRGPGPGLGLGLGLGPQLRENSAHMRSQSVDRSRRLATRNEATAAVRSSHTALTQNNSQK